MNPILREASPNTVTQLLVLGLTSFVGIIVIGLVFVLTSQTISSKRDSVRDKQHVVSELVSDSQTSLKNGRASFNQLLLERNKQYVSDDDWIKGLRVFANTKLDVALSAHQRHIVEDYLHNVDIIRALYGKSRQWSRAYFASTDDLDNIYQETQEELRSLLEAVHRLVGRERLDQLMLMKQSQQGRHSGNQFIAKVQLHTTRISRLRAIQRELNDVALLSDRLYLATDIDSLVSIKENNFVPALARLQREITSLSLREDLIPDSIANLRTLRDLIFGRDHYHDVEHQTLVTGVGGLYNNKLDLLNQQSYGDALFQEYQTVVSRLERSHFDLTRVFESENIELGDEYKELVDRSFLIMMLVTLMIAIIFGALTYRVVRQLAEMRNLKDANTALDRAKQMAEENAKAKGNFLAKMSHEIRTPLNGVLGMAEFLKRTELSHEQRQCLDVIQNSGNTLSVIIDDILDYSKLSEGKLEFHEVDIDCRQWAARQVLAHKSKLDPGVTIEVDIDDAMPEQICVDPARMQQALDNLLGNAVKFTHSGKIVCGIKLLEDLGDQLLCRVKIADTGIGMDADTLARIFDPFEQADSSTSREYGGTGLGLSIARELIELAGGHLRVESELGRGTTFIIDVPLNKAKGTESRMSEEVADKDLSRLNVLVAEDNSTNQLVIQKLLERLGVGQYTIAENGMEAVEQACQAGRRYDAIFMDCEMPQMDGYEATEKIRSWEQEHQVKPIPICALTAHALDEHRERTIEVGMNEYISKPISIDKIKVFCESVA